MPNYVTIDENGKITAAAEWPFPGSIPAAEEVVRGYDGGLYYKSAVPSVPSAVVFASLRTERDRRLTATDYLLMQDYPLSGDQRAAVQVYRQALRDLPAQPGAPWDGGGEGTPWPELPDMLKKRQNVSTSGYTPGI